MGIGIPVIPWVSISQLDFAAIQHASEQQLRRDEGILLDYLTSGPPLETFVFVWIGVLEMPLPSLNRDRRRPCNRPTAPVTIYQAFIGRRYTARIDGQTAESLRYSLSWPLHRSITSPFQPHLFFYKTRRTKLLFSRPARHRRSLPCALF